MLGLAAAGAGEGLWLRAQLQTAGRGRQGRAWVSPVGNLYASTIVRLRPGDPAAPTLALVAGVALAEVIGDELHRLVPRPGPSAAPGRLSLKWPNDLLLDGAKLSGILLERSGEAVVIGVGVNVAHHPEFPDRPTTSLVAHRVEVDTDELLHALAERFRCWLGRWRAAGVSAVREQWLALAYPTGTPLTVRLPDDTVLRGCFDTLATDGALLLRVADGTTRAVHAGDVFTL